MTNREISEKALWFLKDRPSIDYERSVKEMVILLDEAEARGRKAGLEPILKLVNEQAEDEGLWALNLDGTLPIGEAYLQQELRKLHAVIERTAAVNQPNDERK